MPRKGYWVECMPLWDKANENAAPDMYKASMPALPSVMERAPSASQAIEKLRNRLQDIKKSSRDGKNILPKLDNPVRPPKRPDAVSGWMSVYIEVQE